MLPRLILIIVLLAGISFGGYTAYNNYYNAPEKVVARATENVTKLKTVHADIKILSTARSTDGTNASVQSDISAISDIDIPTKSQKTHMTIQFGQNTVTMDLILLPEGQMYLKMPSYGPDWVGMNLKDLKDKGQLPIDPQSNDYYNQSVGFLKSVKPGSITKLEDDTVDGVKAYRYRVDISTTQYIEYLKQLGQDSKTTDSFKDAAVKSDIWIDQKTGYIIRMSSDIKNLSYNDPKSSQLIGTADMTMQIDYSKFNQPVTIAKPEGTIYTMEEYIQKLQSGK